MRQQILSVTLIITIVAETAKWPNPEEDPLVFVANPIEADLPGHWIPLSILKAKLEGTTSTTKKRTLQLPMSTQAPPAPPTDKSETEPAMEPEKETTNEREAITETESETKAVTETEPPPTYLSTTEPPTKQTEPQTTTEVTETTTTKPTTTKRKKRPPARPSTDNHPKTNT